MVLTPGDVRMRLGLSLLSRVAGPDALERRERIHHATSERWFAPRSPVTIVHADSSMFVGGLRALLLQSLHPLAMAGVADHSGFRGDPWGRLQRTSAFLGTTTFGSATEAQRAVDRVRGVHGRISGTAPDGRAYAADDPHLLRWVHIAEVDSFLAAHDRYGSRRLTGAERDEYVAQTAMVARALGADDPPASVADLHRALDDYRPELASTPAARSTARFLLLRPPVPLALRGPYAMLSAAAVGLLPRWARLPLRLPYLPLAEATVVRAGGVAVTHGVRWVMAPVNARR
ncbi:oxygenase MpaB family protein [Solicola gregarius]|uniref:DUF2236 domain-containing protein n=1 Tax=Solicola gregarius TaxID=2908642 RepID=A0AA46YLT4_9ACTN|nr:oxygenase MpaB family protein [Solicola gregarius]UYM05831.1 DUF2236 domain-containing protein [Solicola gregarius]